MFYENKLYLLLIGYVLRSQGTFYDCNKYILRTSCFGVFVLACKYAYVNVCVCIRLRLCAFVRVLRPR